MSSVYLKNKYKILHIQTWKNLANKTETQKFK